MKLIASTPRAYSTYIWRCIQHSWPNVTTRHESQAEISVGYGEVGNHKHYDTIIHQVRHPLPCISSMTALKAENIWRNIGKLHPKIQGRGWLYKGMLMWYHWNKWCEDISEFTYKVEDLVEMQQPLFDEWCEALNLVKYTTNPFDHHDNQRWVNSRPHKNYTWNDLHSVDSTLTEDIIELMEKYGYEKDFYISSPVTIHSPLYSPK